MNRNILLTAIAAVVVVGVAAGILFAGGGQPQGQLSGALGPASTTLTLTATDCSDADAGNITFTLSGALLNATGAGVPDRTIALRTAHCDAGACSIAPVMDFATTGADGGFSFVKTEPPTPEYDRVNHYYYYRAAFAGDAEYAGCASGEARKPC